MPDWLLPALLVVAAIAALYLILVMAQLIVVAVLRRQFEPTRRQVETAQQDVATARKRLDQLAPFIASGSREMPFGPLYDQASALLGKATQSVHEAQKRVDAIVEDRIAEMPPASALRLVPMTREITQRIGMREGARNAALQLTAFNDSMARITQLQNDIAALPYREKEALAQVEQHAQRAAAGIEAEARPRLLLADEREILRQANAHLAQAKRLLGTESPTEAAVVAAYPMRLKSAEQLDSLDAMLAETAQKRAEAEAGIAAVMEQLAAHRIDITSEEGEGYQRPTFAAAADEFTAQSHALKNVVASGDYATAATQAAELQTHIAAQAASVAALRAERAKVQEMATKAERNLDTIGRWIKETPAHFDLDRTRAVQQTLQDGMQQLRALAPLEDIAAMAPAADIDLRVDEDFRKASSIRGEFEANRARFDEITSLMNENSVQSLAKDADDSARALEHINTAYWGSLSPEKLTDATSVLLREWDGEKASLVSIPESELPRVLERLQVVREAYLAAGGMHADAVKAIKTSDTDRALANDLLHDDAINHMLAEMKTVADGSPSLASSAQTLFARVDALRGQWMEPAPDYKSINTEAQRARKDAEAFMVNHHQQLQQARTALTQVKKTLDTQHAMLARLDGDPRIDFTPVIAPVATQIGKWLSAVDTLATQAPFDDVQQARTTGESLTHSAAEALESASATGKYVSERMQHARMALAELNGVMSSGQAGLTAMSDIGSAQWGTVLLDDARKPMTEALEMLSRIDQPAKRIAPDDAATMIDRVATLVAAARERADDAHTDIARRAGLTREARIELQDALAEADDLAEARPMLAPELDALKRQTNTLQARAVEATSYAEGLDALTQAGQRARQWLAEAPSLAASAAPALDTSDTSDTSDTADTSYTSDAPSNVSAPSTL